MIGQSKITAISALLLFALLSIGCSDDDGNVVAPTPLTSNVRVVHTSYDAPAVDISVDGTVAISDLSYPTSSGYAELNAGSRAIKVTPANATSPVVIDANLTLEEGKDYTVFAVGPVAAIEAVVAVDARAENSAKAKVRFAHLSSDAPAVDIKLNNGDGPAVFTNAKFKDVADYVEVDPGTYTFAVTPAGANTEVVVFNPVTVEAGGVYTVAAIGTLSDSDNYAFAVRVFIDNDAGDAYADLSAREASFVKVTHASPDAPGVDLLIDNSLVGTNLTFPNNTGYVDVAAGTRNVKVNVTNTSTTVIEADLSLAAGRYYSVFAVDSVANLSAIVLEDDLTPPAAGNAHARFIHLSPNAPAVDITLTDGTVVFGNISFKASTAFTPLPAGTYDLQVRVAGTSTIVLQLPGITLENGKIYTVFAKGFVNGSAEQALGAEIIINQ